MKFEKMHWLGFGIGVFGMLGSVLLFRGGKLLYFLLVISLVVGLLPFVFSFLLGQSRQKEKEEKFFLKNGY